MSETDWSDAKLGELVFDGYSWEGSVAAPAFDAFGYQENGEDAPDGRYTLQIEDEAGNLDRAAAVALVSKVLQNEADLVQTIATAFWNDVNGTGPDSDLWWHGDLNFADDDDTGTRGSFLGDILKQQGRSWTRPESLFHLMRLHEIVVREQVDGYDRLLVELRFEAAFEPEHGVGILTDGNSVLGIGYQLDVQLFGN